MHELFAAPQHPYTIGLLGAVPRPGGADSQGRLQEIPGRVPSLAELPTACAFAPRCPSADELSRTRGPPSCARCVPRPPRRLLPPRWRVDGR